MLFTFSVYFLQMFSLHYSDQDKIGELSSSVVAHLAIKVKKAVFVLFAFVFLVFN